MNTFKEFYYQNYGLIKKTVAYYGLSVEEIQQECALVYYENPIIESLFLDKEFKRASSIFSVELRRSIKSLSGTSKGIRNHIDYKREKDAEERILESSEILTEIESSIVNQLFLDGLRKKHGDELINELLEYYEYGPQISALKYGITNSAMRQRISRIIKKIQEGSQCQ